MDIQQIAMLFLSAGLGFIGYLVSELKNNFKERLKENADEIKRTQEDLSEMKAALPHTFVMRDDFLRAVSNLDVKVDRVACEISEINKSLNKLLGGEKA